MSQKFGDYISGLLPDPDITGDGEEQDGGLGLTNGSATDGGTKTKSESDVENLDIEGLLAVISSKKPSRGIIFNFSKAFAGRVTGSDPGGTGTVSTATQEILDPSTTNGGDDIIDSVITLRPSKFFINQYVVDTVIKKNGQIINNEKKEE